VSLRRNEGPTAGEVLRRPSLVVGVLLAAVGAVLLVTTDLAALLPANDVLVAVVGGVAALAGVVLLRRRRGADRVAGETGDPELPVPAPAPGDRFDRQLDRVDRLGSAPVRTRQRIRRRLHDAAVAAVRRRRRVSEGAARELVAAGEWTDDPHAAVFVGDGAPPPSLVERVPAVVSLQSRFAFEARRTVTAVLALMDHDEDDGDAPDPDEAGDVAPGPATAATDRTADRETRRWTGVGALSLLAGAVGMAFTQPAVLLVAVVGVTYAAFARRARPPTVDLAVERDLSTNAATPGDEVRVTVRVENVGDGLLADLRLVDGVPPGLTVVSGSPRLGTALRPGKSATFSYTVEAVRGRHEFGPLQVLARDASGARERETTVDAPATLDCRDVPDDAGTVPLYGAATRYAGRVSTDVGGAGTEFHATREYRAGDPAGRVDWNRFAATRELATLLFREERAATVVLLVDTRERAYRSAGPGDPHAVQRSVEAAARVFESLLDGGDRVGVASFGPRGAWLAPGAGTEHRERGRRLLSLDPAFGHAPPEEEFLPSARVTEVRRRAPSDAQFLLFSPATDGYLPTVARRLQAHGHPVTLVSPDVTAGDSTGRRLAAVERATRLDALRQAGVRVVDWAPGEDLTLAIERAAAGWSA
jgi:uncharacterized repeat protein (TIGR01451 family)